MKSTRITPTSRTFAENPVAALVQNLQHGPHDEQPQPVVPREDALEAVREPLPLDGDARCPGDDDAEPKQKTKPPEQRAHFPREPREEPVGPPERDTKEKRIQPCDDATQRALVLLAFIARAGALDGEKVVVLQPADEVERLAFGVALAVRVAGESGEDGGDVLGAVERSEEPILVEAHPVEFRGRGIFDHAHAFAAVLLHGKMQPVPQTRPQRFEFADGEVQVRLPE
jgi:hypothetical protein